MKLARLIADLEPAPRSDIYFHFCTRFDCKHDEETIRYVAQKFKVSKQTTKRKATGWPNGPNQMMGESYEFLVEESRRNRYLGAKAVLFMESDCVPLCRDWIDKLKAEYQACGRSVLGAWIKSGDASSPEHINGNCIISLALWRRVPQLFHPPSRGGWDATLARFLLPVGHPSRLIWSDYQLGMDHNPWRGCDYLWEQKRYRDPANPLFGQDITPCWFHGIKTPEGLDCARQRLLNES